MTGMFADDADFTGAAIFRADLSYIDLSESTIDFYRLPTSSLGPSRSYVSSFLPRIIDVAGYTCQTQIFPEGAAGGTDPTIDSNDCMITTQAIGNAVEDVAGLFTGGEEIQVAALVRKIVQDLASQGFDRPAPSSSRGSRPSWANCSSEPLHAVREWLQRARRADAAAPLADGVERLTGAGPASGADPASRRGDISRLPSERIWAQRGT